MARKSSAPASEPPSRPHAGRAVSIRIGTVLPPARSRAHTSAVEPGEHHVEDHRVVGVLLGEPEPLGTVEGDVDGVPLRLQPALQGVRDRPIVLP